MKTQKELKEKYMTIIKKEVWPTSERMQEYARKECEYVVEFSNGNIIDIEKPTIQKNFCFGFGMYATYTDEELQRAEGMADKAKTDVNYFISENMKPILEKIEALKKCLEGKKECYTYIHYSGQPATSDLMTYTTTYVQDNPEWNPGRWKNLESLKKLSSDDIQLIIDGLEEVANKFLKRLNTYLKKYGLEKLNVWTYCRD